MYKLIEKFLTPNPYSRPARKMKKVKGIVIHWVANAKSSATANRNFFENRKSGTNGYGSAHEIIDLNGDVVLCIPYTEIAFHVGSKTYTKDAIARFGSYPNDYTYGIECTHLDNTGLMTKETYTTLVERCADLCLLFSLNPLTDLWLHKEVVGWKDCHRWFVNNPDKWEEFKKRVQVEVENKIIRKVETILFKDDSQISGYAKESVYRLKELGIANGTVNGEFKPHEPVNREMMCVFLDRLLKHIESKER